MKASIILATVPLSQLQDSYFMSLSPEILSGLKTQVTMSGNGSSVSSKFQIYM
jgi:hypothetical protein